jgi:hypothetical protein
MVYKHIEFPTTWHVLDRPQAMLSKREWPVPPKAQIYESRVTLIRPHTPLEILETCHLVYEEARPILKRRTAQHKARPLRYLVDFSAAWALVGPSSPLKSCLGVTDGGSIRRENRVVKSFVQMCTRYLSQTRQTQNGSRGTRTIEMTITHNKDIVYGSEVAFTAVWLQEILYYAPTRLVVVYQSPLPMSELYAIPTDPGMAERTLRSVPMEPEGSDQVSGVFVRPLEEAAFQKHVDGLEWY